MKFSIFPRVNLSKPKFSWKDLSTTIRTTASQCLLTPIWHRRVYPHDDFYIDVTSLIESFPLLTAFSGSYEVNYDFYFEPLANLYGYIDNDVRVPTDEILQMPLWTMCWYGAKRVESTYPSMSSPFIFGASPISGILTSGYTASVVPAPVAPGSLANYLGYPAGYTIAISRIDTSNQYNSYPDLICADPFFMYLDIFRTWYCNPQESSFAVPVHPLLYNGVSTEDEAPYLDTYFSPQPEGLLYQGFTYYPLAFLDAVFMMLRSYPVDSSHSTFWGDFVFTGPTQQSRNFRVIGSGGSSPVVLSPLTISSLAYPAYSWLSSNEQGVTASNGNILHMLFDIWNLSMFPNGGLLPCTYKMDMNRGVLNVQGGNIKATFTENENGTTDVTEVWYANRLQRFIDTLNLSGGRFSAWVSALWDIKPRKNADVPQYVGSYRYTMTFDDISATAESNGVTLGQQASIARGFGSTNRKKSARIRFKSDTYGHLMCIFYIRPRVQYSTGIFPEDRYKNFADLYNWEFENVGYVDVPSIEFNALHNWVVGNFTNPDGSNPNRTVVDYDGTFGTPQTGYGSVGRRLAWTEVDTDIDRNYGQFTAYQDLSTWVFNREYTNVADGTRINPSLLFTTKTSYMNPLLFNLPFADQSIKSQNFRVMTHLKIAARRPKGARTQPHM